MSVNGRGAIAPQLTSAELESLREFWDVLRGLSTPVLELRNRR